MNTFWFTKLWWVKRYQISFGLEDRSIHIIKFTKAAIYAELLLFCDIQVRPIVNLE